MKYNILICGTFDFIGMATGGQPVKTRELYNSLKEDNTNTFVDYLELLSWRKRPIKILFQFFRKAFKADSIIMLPAHNGLFVFSFLLLLAKKLFGCGIYYDVIGGWLPDLLPTKDFLARRLKKFNGIWVETNTMKKGLEALGFRNVTVINNFKHLKPITSYDSINSYKEPYKLCTFSRVMAEKGIGDAVKVVQKINEHYGRVLFQLDIYGPIDDTYAEEFSKIQCTFGNDIRYMGVRRPEDSVEIIKNYFFLLFPTHFYTEGIPGTIVDAYFAGVPVVSAEWQNSHDVILPNQTGILYPFDNFNALEETLKMIADNPSIIFEMKGNCIKVANRYSPSVVITQIKDILANK